MGKLLYIFNRLREPSTHASLMGICLYFGISGNDFHQYESMAVIVFGALGVFLKEGQPETKVKGF